MLNPRQERFCQEYVIDLNASQAAIRAGYASNSANVTGAQLLANPKIQAKIQELQKEIGKRLEITADQIARELSTIAFSKVSDFVKIEDFEIGKGRRKKTVRGVTVLQTNEIPKEILPAIAEIRQTQHGISLKLHNKVGALELLGKHIGFFAKDNEEKPLSITINGKAVAVKK